MLHFDVTLCVDTRSIPSTTDSLRKEYNTHAQHVTSHGLSTISSHDDVSATELQQQRNGRSELSLNETTSPAARVSDLHMLTSARDMHAASRDGGDVARDAVDAKPGDDLDNEATVVSRDVNINDITLESRVTEESPVTSRALADSFSISQTEKRETAEASKNMSLEHVTHESEKQSTSVVVVSSSSAQVKFTSSTSSAASVEGGATSAVTSAAIGTNKREEEDLETVSDCV